MSVRGLRLSELIEPIKEGAQPSENRYSLYVHCSNMYCHRGSNLPIHELMMRYGDITLGELEGKLICSGCRRREFAISLLWRV